MGKPAVPTLDPGKEGKGGRKAGEARELPPYAHARGMKGGTRVVERWGKPGNSHPMPRQRG